MLDFQDTSCLDLILSNIIFIINVSGKLDRSEVGRRYSITVQILYNKLDKEQLCVNTRKERKVQNKINKHLCSKKEVFILPHLNCLH